MTEWKRVGRGAQGTPSPRVNLYRSVASALASDIEADVLSAGQSLAPERELCSRFGVSRPTVRKALLLLKDRGLVATKSGRAEVLPFAATSNQSDPADPIEIAEAECAVMSEIAGLATAHAGGAGWDRIVALAVAFGNASAETRSQAWRQFSLRLVELSGSSVLHRFVLELWRLRTGSPFNVYIFGRADALQIERRWDLAPVIHAISERKPEEARAAMRDHLRRTMVNLALAIDADMHDQGRLRMIEYGRDFASRARSLP
jgi:GntR family transcriptional regulator, hexuronate regulon transcriptional repressor